jgi:tetrahedral aminopeptidase
MIEFLKKLCSTYGPSGREHRVVEVIQAEIKDHVDSTEVDPMGSLIAFKKGKSDAKRLMFAGHMDEIGLVATYIDKDGFIQFSTVGGVNPKNKIGGSRVMFENGIMGVVQQREVFKQRPTTVQELFIDIGVSSKEATLEQVKVGDFAVFDGPPVEQGNYFISKALDDRVGCYVMVEALKRLSIPEYDTYFVFTSQEEVGCRGAKTAAYRIDPHLGLALDVTLVGDTPEEYPLNMELGKGVAIKSRDAGIIVPTAVVEHLVDIAKKEQITYHMEVLPFGGTDASSIQLTKNGVLAGTLSIPTRYVHSPSEMLHLGDLEQTIKLTKAVCEYDLPI